MESVERVIMNKDNGSIGLGIAVTFHEKYHHEELGKMEGYRISLSKNEPDGWLLFSGANDASGPWIFINNDVIKDKIEVLGEL